MFQEFSGGYYLGRFYVEPWERAHASMQRDQHEDANRQVYADGEGLARLDNPLVVKLDERHFPVHGDESVPADTLAVPQELLDDTRVDDPPALKEVLLAKADRAGQLMRLFGIVPPDGSDPTLQ